MKLLVALDIDGTVLDHDEVITERVRTAVADAVAGGAHVVLATGRSLHGTLPVLDRLGLLEGWAVCSNGAMTLRLDPLLDKGYEISDVVTFDAAPVLRLMREHLPLAVFAVEDDQARRRLTADFPEGELTGEENTIVAFHDLVDGPTTRVIVRSPESTPEDFLAVVERIGLHGVSYAVGWTAWLDLAPDGVSKASALEVVRERLGVAAQDTVAVGDGRNDVEMLAWAGRGVAMGQAVPEVQAAADEVTAPVEEDGVAVVLEDLLAHRR
ncbi:HAD family hydrolase [Kineosporia sp. A_224]|uniref:HAD family hydrolase n=1 Tax=Kineosporia sp. A_224 TaxID=1962180 RepID=UPI000B4B3219|nr:HAD family hydrolase [Kineosporia sp. A_224]